MSAGLAAADPDADDRTMNPLARVWHGVVGPSGWRSIVGPVVFVLLGIGLLVYDHLNQRVTDVVFWLTLGLIVTVFGRMLETNRRQSRALARQRREALDDAVTGLRNRHSLEADIAAAAAAAGPGWVLVLVELSGLETHGDRRGYAAGDELLRRSAHQLAEAVAPLGGIAYRVAASRLAALVPAGERSLGEIVLATSGSLRGEEGEAMPARAHGEVAIPAEAGDAEAAFQLAGTRLATQRQSQLRSARRQAHAVLMAALAARQPELRDELRVAAYRAISLARRLEMSAGEIDDVALAAELQSIGLLSVPEAILDSEARFEAERIEPIRNHPLEGERIVAAASGLAPVATLVRSSAERFDGSGAPDGLAGEAIPLGARAIAVAVAYTAMTSPRPHRQARGSDEALAELRRGAGSQFDPRVVEALSAELAEEATPIAAG
ncbi:MAG: HD domain-containing phosphohydrolase [Solirubrobacterales bacterium]